jgi:hypothetical protein
MQHLQKKGWEHSNLPSAFSPPHVRTCRLHPGRDCGTFGRSGDCVARIFNHLRTLLLFKGRGVQLTLLHSSVALCFKSVSQLFCNHRDSHSFSKLPGCGALLTSRAPSGSKCHPSPGTTISRLALGLSSDGRTIVATPIAGSRRDVAPELLGKFFDLLQVGDQFLG